MQEEVRGFLFDGKRVGGSHLEFGVAYGLVTVRNCFSSTAELIQTQRDTMALYLGAEVFGDNERLGQCQKLVEEAQGILDQPINNDDSRTIRQLLVGQERECVFEGIQAGARLLGEPGVTDASEIDRAVIAAQKQVSEIVSLAER